MNCFVIYELINYVVLSTNVMLFLSNRILPKKYIVCFFFLNRMFGIEYHILEEHFFLSKFRNVWLDFLIWQKIEIPKLNFEVTEENQHKNIFLVRDDVKNTQNLMFFFSFKKHSISG